MNEAYRPLIEALRSESLTAYFQSRDQLVVSRQQGLVMPFRGNSCWVTYQAGTWYLCTWAPTCYRVPPQTDLVRLCVEFVDCGHIAQVAIPAGLLEKYRLVELSDHEAASIFETSPHDAAD